MVHCIDVMADLEDGIQVRRQVGGRGNHTGLQKFHGRGLLPWRQVSPRPSRTDPITLVNRPLSISSESLVEQQETDKCYNECAKMLTGESKEDLARQAQTMEI